MSGKVIAALVVGCALGAAGGFWTAKGMAQAQIAEAKERWSDFAQKNNTLTNKNEELQQQMQVMESSTYDRQKIRECMFVSGVLSQAISHYITDQPMGALAKGMLTRHMAHTMVAVQGKSRAAALDILLQDQAKVDGECLDGAHIKADPLGLWSKSTK